MSILFENWFFLLIIVLCIGMHFFHGHGHGHGHHADDGDAAGEQATGHSGSDAAGSAGESQQTPPAGN